MFVILNVTFSNSIFLRCFFVLKLELKIEYNLNMEIEYIVQQPDGSYLVGLMSHNSEFVWTKEEICKHCRENRVDIPKDPSGHFLQDIDSS